MDIAERMRLVRTIEKMNENKKFTQKIGLKDVSVFWKSRKKKRACYDVENVKETHNYENCKFGE